LVFFSGPSRPGFVRTELHEELRGISMSSHLVSSFAIKCSAYSRDINYQPKVSKTGPPRPQMSPMACGGIGARMDEWRGKPLSSHEPGSEGTFTSRDANRVLINLSSANPKKEMAHVPPSLPGRAALRAACVRHLRGRLQLFIGPPGNPTGLVW
jgi:hypothetical protein